VEIAPPRPAPVVAPPEPAPRKEQAPATVTLSIDTAPPGAEVIDSDGNVLGNTPFQGRFPAGSGTARLSLQKEGFRERRLTLPLEQDQKLSVKLEKRAAARPRPAPAAAPKARPENDDNDRRKL